ncbi:helix-turn-helix domain-containing protein [Fundidesulfovibrio magnetotacticus]|uniref:helix-turn-helix domain-containing protein n=1 Tax=Fundidesulfovibrio magnetotacticus TaxID=2730080 RepID=UPI0015634A3E|nr:helix-turn-helix transcriptional regulator [Fundidesulfovibrio magnetotacticus]
MSGQIRFIFPLVKIKCNWSDILSDIGDRLAKLGKILGKEEQELGRIGGVTKETFSKYKNGLAYPRCEALQRWVAELGLNANWLLIGEEPMFRSESAVSHLQDPIAQRVETVAKVMREAGASDEEIRRAVMAAVGATTSPVGDQFFDAGGKGPVAKRSVAGPSSEAGKE